MKENVKKWRQGPLHSSAYIVMKPTSGCIPTATNWKSGATPPHPWMFLSEYLEAVNSIPVEDPPPPPIEVEWSDDDGKLHILKIDNHDQLKWTLTGHVIKRRLFIRQGDNKIIIPPPAMRVC